MDPITLKFSQPSPKKLELVYIIDDSPIERSMLVDYFSKYQGLKIQEFPTGDDCVKHLVVSGNNPDIILLDYFLDAEVAHSKDGLEILSKLKEISPYSSIIMYTSVENDRIIELARKKGAYSYIIKGTAGFEKLDSIIEKNFIIKNNKL